MNTKEFFNNDVEVNVSEEEIVLAPPTELYDEAKEIAQNTSADEKYPFTLQYDANQKDFLQSMLQMVGAIVEDDDEKGHNLSTRMNMTQLAFIKRLESVERVKTDEGRNPFLMEDAVKPETVETQTAQVMTLATDAMVEAVAEPAMANANDGIATACESGSSSSCCCPTNKDMQSAQMIEVEKNVKGCICCPGAEQWFKFTVPKQGDYTIYTTGSLDTEGVLYDCCGAEANIYDDTEGKINFRIRSYLYPGQVYYVKVKLNNNDTGNYGLLVTDRILVDSAAIQIYDNEDVIILEKGVTYELPRGDEDYYALLDIEGTTPANFGVELSPGTAYDQRVYWFESGNDIISTEYHWYNNNIKYQTLTAKETGGARLYVRDWCEQGKGDMKYVAVIPQGGSLEPVTGIALDYTSLTMDIGDYQKLTATVFPSTATVRDVDWESDNPNVATVTPYGRVKGVAYGTANIYAKAMDGSGKLACCTVHVCHIPVTGVELRCETKTISLGDSEYLFETVLPENASNKNVTWRSADSTIASVDYEGLVTAKKRGKTNITVKTVEGNYTATCEVTVDPRPKVIVEEDNEGVYDFFKVTFPDSEGGLVWKSIGADLSKLDDSIYLKHYSRFRDNNRQEFSTKQLALLYRFDPLGVEHYVINHWLGTALTSEQILTKKDEVYWEIFGTQDVSLKHYYFQIINGQIVYGDYVNKARDAVYSNAEVMFGMHLIPNYVAMTEIILRQIFSSIPGYSYIQLGVELVQALFFSGSIVDSCSTAATIYLDKYVENNPNTLLSDMMGWPKKLWDCWNTLVDAAIATFTPPNVGDLDIYKKIKEQNYRVEFKSNNVKLSMEKIVERCVDN